MLKLTLSHAGSHSKVELNGQDISKFLRRVLVETSVGEPTRAALEYTGAVVIEADGGVFTLEQAEHCVRCDECAKVVKGEEQPVRVIEVTNICGSSKAYAALTE